MAKQFIANRSGQTPTLDEVPNETIKIYATEAALDADLANLEENEIVATDEDNNTASGTQYPVDIVQEDNMHAVTSNAVAEQMDWEKIPSNKVSFTIDTSGTTTTFGVELQHCYRNRNLLKLSFTITPTATIPAPSGNGNMRFFIDIDGVEFSEKSNESVATFVGDRIHLMSLNYITGTPDRYRATIRYSSTVSTASFTYAFIVAI